GEEHGTAAAQVSAGEGARLREIGIFDRVHVLRLVSRLAWRQVLVRRRRTVRAEQARERGPVECIVDGPSQVRVALEERACRVESEVCHDRLLLYQEMPPIALEVLRERRERRRVDDAVVGLPLLELEADLRGERAEARDQALELW